MTSASTSALVLIGWDDIKGRPIYSKKQPESSSAIPAKKKKAPIKKGIIVTAERKAKTKSQRGNHHKNGKGRRNIPTVQVAVGSLMTGIANDDNVELSFDEQINQQTSFRAVSKPARKVSFSPTSKSFDNDTAKRRDSTNSSKPIIVPNTKSWDKKRRGYGSKKFSHGSGYISPVFVLEGAGGNNVGWGGTSKSVGSDHDDTHSGETEQLDIYYENEGDEVLSVVNDDLSSALSRNDGVGVSFSPTTPAAAGDIESVGHDSIDSSLDNHSGSEREASSGLFSYGELDNHDDVASINQQPNESIPEMIHVEKSDTTATNDVDNDLTVKADESGSSAITNSIGHLNNHTPSTKTADETSYKLHSGGTNDFIDYDIPLDEPNALDNLIQKGGGKKRSYGCSEKPVWVTNRQAKASIAAISGNVVGWDEVKCRPIFAKPKKKVDENELDESNDDVSDDRGDIAGDDANIKSHKRRSYSSRFRKTSLTKAIEQMSVLTSPKEADDHSDIDSSQEQENCSSRDDVNLDSENDEEDGTRAKSNVDFDFEMDEVSNDENAHHIQPTESSSLEAARAFFRYLDSNHRLVVDQTDASPRVSSEVIRTTRQIVHSDQLRTEYSEYCDMLAQTGVAPITISEFANNWNRYFVGKGIRDGLFDED